MLTQPDNTVVLSTQVKLTKAININMRININSSHTRNT